MLLQDHKAPARVTGGNVTPRWVQFLLQPAPGIKVNKVEALSREIAIALGAPTARVKAENGAVKVEVPRNDPQPVSLMRLCSRLPSNRIPLGAAVLGLADDGAPLLVRLPSPDVAHLLVAGTTGSGKSVCINAIVMSLIANNMPEDLRLVMIDPKMVELIRYNGLPHLYGKVETELERIVTVLRWVTREMDARYKKFAELGARHFTEYNLQMVDKGEEK